MKNYKIFLSLIFLIFVISGYGFYKLGLNQGIKNLKHIPEKVVADVLYWHDPMVPGHKFDKPGKSPFMDMDLVPVYADHMEGEANNNSVKIDTKLQQNLGIRIAPVVEKLFSYSSEFAGNIVYDERNTLLIQTRAAGYLEKLIVRTPQQSVQKDQVLAELFIPEWVAIQEEYLAIKQMKLPSEDLLLAAQQRMKLIGIPNSHIRLIQSTNVVQPHIKITAPIDGIITELSVREGMTLSNATPLFKVNSLKTVWVHAQIPETMSQDIYVGAHVQATANGISNTTFDGKIDAILPEIDQETRTFTARIELQNINSTLLPGMFVRVYFNPKSTDKVLTIPTEAVIQTGKRTLVFIAENENFIPVEIRIGREINNKTEIISGLEVGQNVVVSGQFLIDSEASLKGIEARMLPKQYDKITSTQKTKEQKGAIK